ncbi:MAG TPA: TadE/TadG family type IV pilus assembly protein [Bryobacteraceae bacterium]|nr:TadE/TadG family type IV pilus assembly protein [Bryobacteraceae bacterium]
MIPARPIPERKRRRGRTGSALIEMAVGWFIITTVFGAAFEYGYIFYQYNSLFNAVNNGARYASMYPYDTNSPTYSDNFKHSVQDIVLYGDPTGSSSTLVLRNLKTSNITITVTGTGDSSGTPNTWSPTQMTVAIATDTNGYAIDGVFGTFTFKGKPTVTYPFVGNYTGNQ